MPEGVIVGEPCTVLSSVFRFAAPRLFMQSGLRLPLPVPKTISSLAGASNFNQSTAGWGRTSCRVAMRCLRRSGFSRSSDSGKGSHPLSSQRPSTTLAGATEGIGVGSVRLPQPLTISSHDRNYVCSAGIPPDQSSIIAALYSPTLMNGFPNNEISVSIFISNLKPLAYMVPLLSPSAPSTSID